MLKVSLALVFAVAACGGPKAPDTIPAPPPSGGSDVAAPAPVPAPPMPPQSPEERLIAEAKQFVADTDKEYRRVAVASSLAEWANLTDITPAHEETSAKASAELSKFLTKAIKAARKFEPILAKLDPATRRQLQLLRFAGQPAPDDPKQADELAKLGTEMASIYGKGKACVPGKVLTPTPPPVPNTVPTGYSCGTGGTVIKDKGCKCPKGAFEGRDAENTATCVTPPPPPVEVCLGIDDASKVLQKSRKPEELLAVWSSWHDSVGRAIRDPFNKFIPLANAGAQGGGFKDVADMWKSGYDMPSDAFEAETDRLWGQMKPLYDQLHCYTRRKLNKTYGNQVQPNKGPIKAHLTGNMWAQSWTWLYKELEPYPGQASINVTPTIEQTMNDSKKMVKFAEAFYTSLGMPELPGTFWERSMFDKPANKEAVCHASAWDVTFANDLRIKMCIQKTQEELEVIHHELGHNYYYAAYYKLPMLFQGGANDGFHEAIGDTIVLSMTPDYYKERGLLKDVTKNEKATINQQMLSALERIAFLPFGLVIDKWRWDVYAGKVSPDKYNEHWWNLRAKYQGIAPPVARKATDFDPGAKYHVPANVAYTRYFLARVLQFQFHRTLCQKAGFKGPLHECSIFKNVEAGRAFWKMLQAGASKPWQDTLFDLTGSRDMDATALLEYFAPLKKWLEAQNKGQTCGY